MQKKEGKNNSHDHLKVKLREAAKKSSFLSGSATKERTFFAASLMLHYMLHAAKFTFLFTSCFVLIVLCTVGLITTVQFN